MIRQETGERAKPFRLVKYFTFTSLVLIFLGTLVISILNTHWARNLQRRKSEDYALLLVENLNHQIFLYFILPVYYRFGKIQLRNDEQFELMDQVVRNTLHSFKIDTLNIYDKEKNIISYSFNREMVGKLNRGGRSYRIAATGKANSKLIQRGNFFEIMLGTPKVTKIATYAPLRAERPLSRMSDHVIGVVEIVQDLTDDYQSIFRFQIHVITSCAVVMGVLFLILVFVVNRGEGIIRQRAREQMRLKEKLNRAEHLSSLGEMIAAISHEIRNPLGIIRSSAELLKKRMERLDPKNTIPTIIVEESNRLNNIITDFLDYARPKQPQKTPCRIDEILEKNVTHLTGQIEAGGYRIHRRFEDGIPRVMVDGDMIYQALLNLMINAMQAMPEGGDITLDLKTNGGAVRVSVADEGDGISEEIREKIWTPFFTTKETGTGLGLGIVKNIVESHGGTVRLENAETGGARITLEIPVESTES